MIPLRITNVKQSGKWPNYIIIHHTAEFYPDMSRFKFDTAKHQVTSYMKHDFMVGKKLETKYNFIVDQQGEDYQVVVSQPLLTEIKYDDIPDRYNNAIHVAFMGNYDEDFPTDRMYRVLAYRVLSPLSRLFYLKEEDILLHSAISTNSEQTCPGEFIDMVKLKTQFRAVRKKKAVARG